MSVPAGVTRLEVAAVIEEPSFGQLDPPELAARLAHELGTPLATIALCAESLLRSCEDPDLAGHAAFQKFPRYLRTIGTEVFRCKRIVEALGSASPGMAGKGDAQGEGE